MSQVDTRFSEEERESLLGEVRTYLPAFLSTASTEQPDPVGDVRELLGLADSDLRRVVAVHICLSESVRGFFSALPEGLRRPLISSIRPPVVSQAIRGPIDWGATTRVRSLAGGDRTLFVSRPARRIFDIPENRALAWLLKTLDVHLRRAVGMPAVDLADEEAANWDRVLRGQQSRLLLAQRQFWLKEVPAERPTSATLRRLRAARTLFYQRHIPDAALAVMRYAERPSEADLTELLCQRYFRPTEDWRLFEVVVALRLARAFAARSPYKRRRLLTGTGGAAYARYQLADGDEVRLHYQSWPETASASLHERARVRQKVQAGPPRPDIFIARLGQHQDGVVLELKATRSPSYIGQGLSQLLGYLNDRAGAFGEAPSGWLIAPASPAYAPAPPGNEELWIVSADEVSKAAVERFAG